MKNITNKFSIFSALLTHITHSLLQHLSVRKQLKAGNGSTAVVLVGFVK